MPAQAEKAVMPFCAVAWGYWVSFYQQKPSRKCSARLDGLAVDANIAQLNSARRALYDSLEARLTAEGLNIGEEP